MEHLEEGIASHFERVPYIVVHQYDRRGFYSFPDRVNNCEHGGRWNRSTEVYSCPQPGLPACAASFLQAWLFFGLLAETIGSVTELQFHEFYVQDGYESWWITTRVLPEYLRIWKEKTLASRGQIVGNLVQTQLALEHARILVSKYCSVSGDGASGRGIDSRITLSLMVLGETLSHAQAMIVELASVEILGWLGLSQQGWGYSEAVLQCMRHDKWCPRSLHILKGLLQQSSIGLLYALRLSYPKSLGLNHDRCDENICRAREQASYSIRHNFFEEVCSCEKVGPNVQQLAQHILDGKLVVLKYVPGTASVEVVPLEEHMGYVIVSHVWADGFGRSDSNTLPICRLKEFVKVFERISNANLAFQARSSFGQPCVPVYFWIDTLAVPMGSETQKARRQAIRNMHQMYFRATCTVVFDAGLMTQTRGGSYAETAMKIASCHWITRLWTLQEAYLSRRLLLNFADTLMDIDDLESMNKGDLVTPKFLVAQNYRSMLLAREREATLRRRISERDEPDTSIDANFLVSVWNALRWRNTSHEQHETLAMAILLQIDTEPFDDAMISVGSSSQQHQDRLDRKMQTLLLEIVKKAKHAIPAELVFLPGPKLPQRGFRWAPRSWLRNGSPEILGPLMLQSTELTTEGLNLCLPGFRFHSIGGTGQHEFESFQFPTDNSLSVWITVQNAEGNERSSILFQGKSLALVTKDRKIGKEACIGLLVAVTELRDRRIYAHILKRVYVCAIAGPDRIRELQTAFRKDSSKTLFGEALSDTQQWCLDGPERELVPVSQMSPWNLSNSWLQGWKIRLPMPQKTQP